MPKTVLFELILLDISIFFAFKSIMISFVKKITMKYLYFFLVILIFSCGEDKHTKDIEENTYYAKYLEIYNAYDSIGPMETIKSLDQYLAEFPNAQDAYIFKAWVLAKNNQISEIEAVFNQALKHDDQNIAIYQYWAALLLEDSSKVELAKNINAIGFKIKANDIVLDNNQTWIYLFENKINMAFANSLKVIKQDTLNNYRYFRTAAVCAVALENDSLFNFYNNLAIKNGQRDSLALLSYKAKEQSIFQVYKKLN